MARNRNAFLFLLFPIALVPGCAPAAGRGSSGGEDTLTIGAYSVVREAFHEGILPAFAKKWAEKTGRKVRFEESYNGSGAQARAIVSGFDADVAILSLEGDIEILVKAGIVSKTWNAGPDRGMVTRSLVVIGVRETNPSQIADWEDLARPGVSVLYPDPKTSGGARWNVNAIYGAALLANGGGPKGKEAGRDLLARVQANVLIMDSSGRQSMATFDRGIGDAVVSYENEFLLRRKLRGDLAPYVVPPSTLLIESPAALVDSSVNRHGNRPLAEAFLAFLRSAEGQLILANSYGFRPLDPKLDAGRSDRPPLPRGVFSMKQLGGWSKIKKEVYDAGGVWDSIFTGKRGLKGQASMNRRDPVSPRQPSPATEEA